jgi:hypothetical protein
MLEMERLSNFEQQHPDKWSFYKITASSLSYHVDRDYVDRSSVNYITKLKKTTVAEIHNL